MQKTVFLGIADWGLGHASRAVPLIKYLIQCKLNCIIGSSGQAAALLGKHFPDCRFVHLPALNVRLNGKHSQIFSLTLQLPHLIRVMQQEHRFILDLASKTEIHGIISDHRYGLYHPDLLSVFLTHQVWYQLPFPLQRFDYAVTHFHHRYIRRFNECWVVDNPPPDTLSGDLSHKRTIPFPFQYTGLLSRFTAPVQKKPDPYFLATAVLSGPEPQRSRLEHELMRQMKQQKQQYCIVRGLPDSGDPVEHKEDNILIYNYLDDARLIQVLENSAFIIARSGYSTLMDLAVLNLPAVLIPTPGQTEQEYLAKITAEKSRAVVASQQEFSLQEATEQVISLPKVSWPAIYPGLQTTLNSFIDRI